MRVLASVLLILVLPLAACGDPARPLSADFGAAVRANMAAQMVDPQPAPAAGAPAFSGRRAADAIVRYESGRVIAPSAEATSDLGE